jgi:hypothetical protein
MPSNLLAAEDIYCGIQLRRQHKTAQPAALFQLESRLSLIFIPVTGGKPVAAADNDIELDTPGSEYLALKGITSRWP